MTAAPQSCQPSTTELITTLRDMRTPLAAAEADRLEFLEGQVEGLLESFSSLSEVANTLKVRLRDQLETFKRSEREYEPGMDPCNDAEFGMKP